MRTPRIYQQTELATGSHIQLDAAASHHLTKVLRMQDASNIILFNGDGNDHQAVLHIQKKQVSAIIQSSIKTHTESSLALTLLLGISKGERMDISMQKSVELGVHTIVPIVTERTVVNLKHDRADKRIKHWQSIIINACEQSGRSQVPLLAPICKLEDYLVTDSNELKIMLNPYATQSMQSIQHTNEKVSFLVGPEGGLSDDEIRRATERGFHGVKMGPRILRTETAAIAAISVMQVLWGDFQI